MASTLCLVKEKKGFKASNSFQRRKIRELEEKGYEFETHSENITVMVRGSKRKMVLPNGKTKKLY